MKPVFSRIAQRLQKWIIDSGSIAGDKLPSARELAAREGVSLPTALAALRVLEREGQIVARERSGFFVAQHIETAPQVYAPKARSQAVTTQGLIESLFAYRAVAPIRLGAATPDAAWLPLAALRRAQRRAEQRLGAQSVAYSYPPGDETLRAALAKRLTQAGTPCTAQSLVLTAGVTQALSLALRVTTKPGDCVAIESPTYFGTLLLLQSLQLRAVEIETDVRTGLSIEALTRKLGQQRIAAVVASPTLHNPTGAIMPRLARKQLVALLAKHDVPLIEDDIYGDLAQSLLLPSAKSFDVSERQGRVIYCGGVSKTLAPGFRLGYMVAGRYREAVMRLRQSESHAGCLLHEWTANEMLASGDYARHLVKLRTTAAAAVRAVAQRVQQSFPSGTKIFLPPVGYLLWVECPPDVDALWVTQQAAQDGISLSPGPMFSANGGFRSYFRLNCANPISPALLRAIDRVGQLCKECQTV